MARPSNRDLSAARALEGELATLSTSQPPVFELVVPALRDLLRTQVAGAYRMENVAGRFTIPAIAAAGARVAPEVIARGCEHLANQDPDRFAFYNPARPEPEQRNRVISIAREQFVEPKVEALGRMFSRWGFGECNQLRALICEGESLLAWVGVFDPRSHGAREHGLLARLIAPLRKRLFLERQLGMMRFAIPALAAALEQLPGAAWVIDPQGRPVFANEAGQRELAAGRSTRQLLVECALRAEQRPRGIELTPLADAGLPRYVLAIRREPAGDGQLVARHARAWGLTAREAEVLARLLHGHSNKSIAADLQCSHKTIEHHVSALLRKANCGSRATLVARVRAA